LNTIFNSTSRRRTVPPSSLATYTGNNVQHDEGQSWPVFDCCRQWYNIRWLGRTFPTLPDRVNDYNRHESQRLRRRRPRIERVPRFLGPLSSDLIFRQRADLLNVVAVVFCVQSPSHNHQIVFLLLRFKAFR